MIKSRRKWDIVFTCVFLLTAVLNVVSQVIGRWHVTSFLYTALVILWMISIAGEISDRYLRHALNTGGVLLISLFILRQARWDLVPSGSALDRLLWYAYYFAFTALPLLSLTIAVYIGQNKKKHPRLRVLWGICLALIALVMTNDLHGLIFKVWYENGKVHTSSRVLLYVIIGWSAILLLMSLVVVLYKCRLMEVRRFWWVPVATGMPGLLLWAVYYSLGGSSPKLHGLSLYNIQEVYLLSFIGIWESCIVVGLIPSVSLDKEREWLREGILESVRDEFEEIKRIFETLWQADEESFSTGLKRISCLGVYIKRRANLELITDARGRLDTKELSLAIRETFDYRAIDGMSVGFEETGNLEVPALLVTTAYEMVEEVLEKVAGSACYIKLAARRDEDNEGFRMTIEADPKDGDEEIESKLNTKELFTGMSGVSISVRTEDETVLIELDAADTQLSKAVRTGAFGRKAAPGLAGVSDYLSIEDEAIRIKTRVHDSMGRCLLINRRYLTAEDMKLKDPVYTEWSRTIAWMEGDAEEAGGSTETLFGHCIRQAEALGIKAVISGDMQLPADREKREVADAAITTHITNVLRHTDADTAYIAISRSKDSFTLVLTDNGSRPAEPVSETGGLKNLRNMTEALGGSMQVESEPAFKLTIIL